MDKWIRNEEGDLIPNSYEITLEKPEILNVIDSFKIQIKTSKSENNKDILTRSIELLQEEYDSTFKKFNVSLIPLLPCHLHSLSRGSNIGTDGNFIEDQHAQICNKCCASPKKSYNDWRDTKDPSEKIAIANKITEISLPKDRIKKKITQIQALLIRLER